MDVLYMAGFKSVRKSQLDRAIQLIRPIGFVYVDAGISRPFLLIFFRKPHYVVYRYLVCICVLYT